MANFSREEEMWLWIGLGFLIGAMAVFACIKIYKRYKAKASKHSEVPV